MPDRRAFIKASTGAVLAASSASAIACSRWDRAAFDRPDLSRVAIVPVATYSEDLVDAVLSGIGLVGTRIRGRRVVLKPNLVEFDPEGVINTHPALVVAAAEAFRRLDAREVIVAEGPGHRRDNEYLLEASGMGSALADAGVRYVDLNNDAVRRVPLRSRFTELGELYLPETVVTADLLVSMPKLKTHHWAGVTLSMKNMFGIVPGAVYGWPKNVLHWQGVQESILDINAALEVPRLSIVDGVVGMEGDGPIRGDPRQVGVLVFGEDPVATDATASRLMSIDPLAVPYLREADDFLGNAREERVEVIGEDPVRMRQDFRVLDTFAGIKSTPLAKLK